MKILVTGAAGFIGSSLARRLLADGHEVIGIDALTDYYDPALKRANLATLSGPSWRFVEGDLNVVDLGDLLRGVEVVYHQAGQPGVRKSWGADFSVYLDANIHATQRLLEAATGSPALRRLVYASSSSVYGDAETYPTVEALAPRPRSPYGVTKLAAEHLCVLYAANFGVPTVALRYFTVYGPGQRPDMAFTRFCRAAVTGGRISIYGDGSQVRDFTFIDDIVAANVAAATAELPAGTVMNVAGGGSVSVNEALALVADLHGSGLDIEYLPPVAGDVVRTGADTSLITRLTGWRPGVSVGEGLARHYDWARTTFATSS